MSCLSLKNLAGGGHVIIKPKKFGRQKLQVQFCSHKFLILDYDMKSTD